jgi:hypothetical protein
MKSKVFRRKMDVRGKLLDDIMDLFAPTMECQDALRQGTHHVLTQVANAMILIVEFSKMYYTMQTVPTFSFEQ